MSAASAPDSSADDATPLVSAEWLAARLGDPSVLAIDIRSVVDGGGREAYEAAHIPGAVHTDYVRDGWRAAKGMAVGMLPEAAHLSVLFARLGLRPDDHAVVVPAGTSLGDFSAASRVYWTLKIAGHHKISILDGGTAAWRTDRGRPVESGPSRARRDVAPYPVRWVGRLRSDLAAVERAVADRSAVLLDSRTTPYFEGAAKSPQAMRGGRLPGAVQFDHAQAFDETAGRLKPKAELVRLLAGLPNAPIVNYCNTGQQAATNWFVLSEVLGRPDVTLYDGSMSEWTEDPAHPVDTGPAKV